MRNRSAQSRKKPGARFRRRSSDTTRACSLSLYSVSTSYRWIRSVLNSIELLYRNREITVQFYKHVLQAENKVSNPTTTIVPIVSRLLTVLLKQRRHAVAAICWSFGITSYRAGWVIFFNLNFKIISSCDDAINHSKS